MKKFLKLNSKTFQEYKTKNYQEIWEKASEEYDGISFDCFTKIRKKEDNKFQAVFSSATEDRHGDIVNQKFKLTAFKQNPVLLDSHSYRSIEDIVGKISKIGVRDGKLRGEIEFATKTYKGSLAHALAEGGFLNTTSIGFIPLKFGDKGVIEESEILEISVVAVPANPEALIEKIKAVTEDEVKIEPPYGLDHLVEDEEDEEVEDKNEEVVECDLSEVENEDAVIDEKEVEQPLENELSDKEVKSNKKIALKIAKELQKTSYKNITQRKSKIYKLLREIL